MDSSLSLVCVLCCLFTVSAYDIFEGLLKQGEPCFDVIKVPDECNITLAENFRSSITHKFGSNEPTTLTFLFTPNNTDKAEQLHECGGLLPSNSAFDPNSETEIFIHGWLDGVCRSFWMREMKEQLFQRGRYNVILIDWTWGNTPDYLIASGNCRFVGEQVGFIISNIMRQTGVGAEKFHVIGHSFGAIASGFAGRYVRRVTGKDIRRITGLDPAFAPFKHTPPEGRLTYRDAQIVDIIHTNGFQCFALGLGDKRPIGHADFYPNGGKRQTSCRVYMLEAFLKGDVLYAIASLEPRICSHLQSLQYYKLSINPRGCQYVGLAYNTFESFKNKTRATGDWAVMGMDYELYYSTNGGKRKYYLETTNICPYYDGRYLLEKKFPFNTSCSS